MARGFPSMTALLGLLAVAGFQNRDKIADLLRGAGGGAGTAGGTGQPQGGLGGLLGGLAGAFGGSESGTAALPGGSAGSFLNGGLNELLERFREAGHGDAAESWVGTGPNREISPQQLEQAIGPDVLQTLSARTGLSRDELLGRLARELPQAVDRYTPDGRLPGSGGTSGNPLR